MTHLTHSFLKRSPCQAVSEFARSSPVMKFSFLLLSFFLASLGPNLLHASPNDEAVAQHENELAELSVIVNNDDLDPELKRLMVKHELEKSLDLAAMSARAIQPFEEYLTTAEVIELVAEFETHLKHLYVNRVASLPGPSVDILENKASSDGKSRHPNTRRGTNETVAAKGIELTGARKSRLPTRVETRSLDGERYNHRRHQHRSQFPKTIPIRNP